MGWCHELYFGLSVFENEVLMRKLICSVFNDGLGEWFSSLKTSGFVIGRSCYS